MELLVEYCVQLDLEQHYSILGEIGNGNYARVYIAKEIKTEEIVAIKSVCKKRVRQSHRSIGAIISEIECMRELRHPYIC